MLYSEQLHLVHFSKQERIRNESDEFKSGAWERPGGSASADG